MSQSLQILCLAVLLAPNAFADNQPVSCIQALQDSLSSIDHSFSQYFCLTGTVCSKDGPRLVILEDRDRRFTFLDWTTNAPSCTIGDLIAASGHYGLKAERRGDEPYAVLKKVEVLQHGAKPVPVDRRLAELSPQADDLRLVRTEGVVIDYSTDEGDSNFVLLTLKDGSSTILVSVRKGPSFDPTPLVDARISLVGRFNRTLYGWRRFSHPLIVANASSVRILSPPHDPSLVPDLERRLYLTPQEVHSLGKRKVSGEVVAVWKRRHLLIREDNGRTIRARLSARNSFTPQTGLRVTAFGHPTTDQFNLFLDMATLSPCTTRTNLQTTAKRLLSPRAIAVTTPGSASYDTSCYGTLITLKGVIRSLPSLGSAEGRIVLDSDGYLVPLETSSCPETAEGLELGCEIEATGVCILETNDYDAQTDTPRISGLTLVLRGKDDILVLSRPPWLTPARFLVILSVMAGVLVLILIWNAALRVLVERRGRELARKQAEAIKARFKTVERTRLATELHDSVVQNLTGAALEIRAAQASFKESVPEASPHLDIALKTINSSRAELRNCIWDLRNQALEQGDIDEAIRITLQPHLGSTKLLVRFNVPRRKIPDNEFHNILCIIRELVVNAVRHGRAKTVRIAGALDEGRILFSVTDDGCGFDPKAAPGMEQGHFGIEGVTERAKTLDGTVRVASTPGKGTHVTVTVALLEEAGL